jgi:NTP pyrophosphatase (non-canonical NTP hydrolase)
MHYSSKEGPMPESKFCVGQQVILKSNAGAVTDVLSGIVDTDIRYEVQLHDGPSVIYTEEELLSITEAVNDSVNAPLSEEDTALVKAAVLDRLASECWTIAHAHGFWDAMERIANEYGDEELISQYQIARCGLIHSEVSELLEAVRESKEENIGLDFHVAEECADIIIRVLDFCGGFDIDLGNAFVAKMEKNRNRPHMHGKKA